MYLSWKNSALAILLVAAIYATYDKSAQKDFISSTYPGQLAFLVAAQHGPIHINDRRGGDASSRSYILFPRALSHPDVIRVAQDRYGKLTQQVDKFGALWYVVPIAFGLAWLLTPLFAGFRTAKNPRQRRGSE